MRAGETREMVHCKDFPPVEMGMYWKVTSEGATLFSLNLYKITLAAVHTF